MLSGKDVLDRLDVQGIGSQPVNRFGGQRHQSPGAQNSCGALQRLLSVGGIHMSGVHNQSQRLHPLILACSSQLPPPAVYSLQPMPIETEIKFRVDDLAGLARRLEAAGFSLQTPRAFESNVLYDTPDRRMRARTEILRIRSYADRWTVTHKRLPDCGPGEDTHKHRIETETEVADGEALAEVFLSLGLVAAMKNGAPSGPTMWVTAWSTKPPSATTPNSKAPLHGSIAQPHA